MNNSCTSLKKSGIIWLLLIWILVLCECNVSQQEYCPFFILRLGSVAMLCFKSPKYPPPALQTTSSQVTPQSPWSGSNPIWVTSNTCSWCCLWCLCVCVCAQGYTVCMCVTQVFFIAWTRLWRWLIFEDEENLSLLFLTLHLSFSHETKLCGCVFVWLYKGILMWD